MDETRTLKDEIAKAAEVALECQDLYEFHQGIGEPPTVLADTDTAKALGEAARTIRALLDALLAQPPAQEEREALEAIYATVRGDEKSECWTIRKFLDDRGIFNDDIQGAERLIEEVCKHTLPALPTQDKETTR